MNDTKANTLTYEFYEGFQRVEFHRWDAIVAEDLLLNSPAGFGIRGLKTFKEFAVQFTNLGYRIDLVDEPSRSTPRETVASSSRSACIGSI